MAREINYERIYVRHPVFAHWSALFDFRLNFMTPWGDEAQ